MAESKEVFQCPCGWQGHLSDDHMNASGIRCCPRCGASGGLQLAVTRAEFEALSWEEQGFVAYLQGQWNPVVPNACPYAHGTEARRAWEQGEGRAMLDVIDSEE